MISRQTAQTGKRVYGGVSQAPNRGQVSAKGASGYIQRELRKQNNVAQMRQSNRPVAQLKGRDGQSDQRSAVAAKALQNMGIGNKFKNHPKSPKGKQAVAVGPKGKGRGQKPPVNPAQQQPAPNAAPLSGAPPIQASPHLIVNPQGQLELPYDQAFGQDQYEALAEANNQLLDLSSQEADADLQYQQAHRDTDLGYKDTKLDTLNTNASSGTLFSSRYGTGVTRDATQYARQKSDLDASHTLAKNSIASRRAAIQTALQQQLAAAAQAYADQLAADAGDLGYGGEGYEDVPLDSNPNVPKGSPNKPKNQGNNKGKFKNHPKAPKGKQAVAVGPKRDPKPKHTPQPPRGNVPKPPPRKGRK